MTKTQLGIIGGFLLFVGGITYFSPNNESPVTPVNPKPLPITPVNPVPNPQPIGPKPSPQPVLPPKVNSYSDALKASKSTDFPILIVFSGPNCIHCKHLEQTTLSDAQVQLVINTQFIYLKINTSSDKEGVSAKYNIRGIPSYVIINNNEKVINQSSGYLDKTAFIQWLQSKKDINNG